MKKLFFPMLTLLSVTFALTVTSCGGDDGVPEPGPALGSKNNPYNVVEAINAVKGLTWTSNTVYDQTGEVYVKGKISRIAEHGTFTDSGVFSNATFYISYNGGEYNELYCYRVHYLGNFAFVPGQTDIKVGDEVVICGKLMNYQNNTPETVANSAYLVSINGETNGGGDPGLRGEGTKENPYSPAEACYVVKDLTWTSNTVYDKTGDVYVRGIISRISAGGTYTESGTYGNASFFISEDGTTNDEFYCFRMLYFGNKEFVPGQTDIKVGDEVIICGKLMNYKGNTPMTVANEAWLYMLNGATDGGPGHPSGGTVAFATNSDEQSWSEATDGTYGKGFVATKEGLKIGYYKHTSTTNVVAPNANHVRIYWNAVLSIASTEGKRIKKIVIGCAPDAGTTSYCHDMTGLEGGASAVANKSALTIAWTGSASKVVLQSNNGQVRMEKIAVQFE